jgi:DNA-binding CsgD family transcriptional regulator
MKIRAAQGELAMIALKTECREQRVISAHGEPGERKAGLRIIENFATGGTAPELKALSQSLRPVIHHKYFACGLLRVYDACILRVVNLDFPMECLEAMKLRRSADSCPLARQWLATRAPIIIRDYSRMLAPDPSVSLCSWPAAEGSVALHAQLDSTGTRGLLFCFGSVTPTETLDESLRYVTPFLFSALAKSFWSPTRTIDCRALTSREIEVIEWMYCGKTNEEIASLLNISVYTVKNHVQKILLKFSATNRTQAVLRAVDAGIVRNPNLIQRQFPAST